MNYPQPVLEQGAAYFSNERVAICVCTYLRPAMLEKCLVSLRRLRIPQGISPFLIVVDNDKASSARQIFEEFARTAPFSCYYFVRKKRGIAAARNRALDKAHQLGADWLTFIDDDEIADRDWLGWLMAHNYRNVPILAGRQVLLVPDQEPYWWETPTYTPQEGRILPTAVTNNVRFSIELVQAGLRFDEGLGLNGGEDTRFFAKARRKGFLIARTERAITYEKAHVSRVTFRRIFKRHLAEANAALRTDRELKGRFRTFIKSLVAIPTGTLHGAALVLTLPFLYLVDQKLYKSTALKSNRKLAKALGRLTAMVGFRPQPYAIIDGE